jgi:hypothetical protein
VTTILLPVSRPDYLDRVFHALEVLRCDPNDMRLLVLVEVYARYPHAGLVSGVELGRWGIPHVGAWQADDAYDTTSLRSPGPGAGVQEVDATGMYCFLTKASTYMKHEFGLFDGFLGPDIDFGMSLRREGYRNFIDWGVSCIHMRREGALTLGKTQPQEIELKLDGGEWKVYI